MGKLTSMTPDSKFRGLEAGALARLSRPLEGSGPIGVDRASLVALLWRYPSFEPYQSWALVQGRDATGDGWLVRRTTWDRSADQARATDPLKQAALMVDPAPTATIEVADARAHGDFAAKVLGRLGELTVPPRLASEVIGIDGVVNGLETQRGRVRLEWWCDGPPGWQAFTDEVERLRLDLDAVVQPDLATGRTGFARRSSP
jgi:hypothetical protein